MQLFLGILLLVMAIFLIVSVLMQSGKSKRLSGSIAGGAETFFGKAKGRTIDALLSKITTVVAILFVLVVIIVYIAFGTSYETPEIIYDPNAIIENIELETTTEGETEGEVVEGETVEGETTEGETVEGETEGEVAEGETAEAEPVEE